MSDPVTNAEVEDVLSSIRRLVSEDKRPLQAQKAAPANDRLVLTPALRVAEMHDEDGIYARDGAATKDAEPTNLADDEDAATPRPDATNEADFDDPAHDYEADPYNFDDEDDEDGESDAAFDLSGLEADQEDPVKVDTDQSPTQDTADTHEEAPLKAANLSAKIEALETAIGKIADTWEPDTPGSDEYSGTEAPAMAWEDDVDRDATGAPLTGPMDDEKEELKATPASQPPEEERDVPTAPPEAEAPQENASAREDSLAFGADDQLLDEEALRDLVSDIVRAELQGALGERITRNVRKLVRREIHRALTAQELE